MILVDRVTTENGQVYRNVPLHDLHKIGVSSAQITEIKLDLAKRDKLNALNVSFDRHCAPLLVDYPQTELHAITTLAVEANAYLADSSISTPLIDAVIAETQEEKSAFAQSVSDKAARFKAQIGRAIGIRRKLVSELEAVQTIEMVNKIVWPTPPQEQ